MEVKVIVIRSGDPKLLADFYSFFGLLFTYHQHGNSPFHYSTHVGSVLLEIYPFAKTQEIADKHLRLGFAVDNFSGIISSLKSAKVVFASEPMATEFGFMAVVCDPEGRKVEVYRK